MNSPTAPIPRTGWRIAQWAAETTLSRAYIRLLIQRGQIRSVKSGVCRIILTSPREYLESLADDKAA